MILTVNAGSSTLKLALYDDELDRPVLKGLAETLGREQVLTVTHRDGTRTRAAVAPSADPQTASLHLFLEAARRERPGGHVTAVGHRVVHGGPSHGAPVRLTPDLIAELDGLAPLAPLHQPFNVAGVRAAQTTFPDAVQVACFDTAFHRDQAWVEQTFALPASYFDIGMRRYGFHGLSYEYIADALARLDPALTRGRVIVAHLGSGASLCALRDGRSVASTMGFSALDGLPMGTRTGQIDPGVLLYLLTEGRLSVEALSDLLYRRSGLLGLSGLSADMRTLEAANDPRADAAIEYFCHRARREIGSLAAAMQGVDGIVFTAGIGENSARVRAEICEGLDWLGLRLDADANARHAEMISAPDSLMTVRIVPTDEEAMIARHTRALMSR